MMWRTVDLKENTIAYSSRRCRNYGTCRLWLRHYWPELLAVFCALTFAFAIVSYAFFHTADCVYAGFVQVDQPVYYACAREYFENGNGIIAANPYSNLLTSTRIYSHLYFILAGWMWRLTGLSFGAIDGIVRMIGAPLMLVFAGQIVRIYVGRGRTVAPLIALALLGGGLAWFYALMAFVAGLISEWNGPGGPDLFKPSGLVHLYISNFSATEYGYGGWHLSVFRNVFYSTEVFYHVLCFACLMSFLRTRYALGCVFLFLTAWAHPFTGALLCAIVTAWLVIEWFYQRERVRAALAAVLAIDALFLSYYNVFLRFNEEHRSVIDQLQSYSATLSLNKLLPAYGLILPLALMGIMPTFAQRAWRHSKFRFLYTWLLVVAFLNFHDKLLPFVRPMQPLHFSHGYLYLPMAILAIRVLQDQYARRAKNLLWGSLMLLVFHLPDNVIWSVETISTLPSECPVFMPSRHVSTILEGLETVAEPQVILVDLRSENLSVVKNLTPVFTKHLVIQGHGFNTPFNIAQQNFVRIMKRRPDPRIAHELGITAILTEENHLPFYTSALGDIVTGVLWHNRDLGVVLVKVSPRRG